MALTVLCKELNTKLQRLCLRTAPYIRYFTVLQAHSLLSVQLIGTFSMHSIVRHSSFRFRNLHTIDTTYVYTSLFSTKRRDYQYYRNRLNYRKGSS